MSEEADTRTAQRSGQPPAWAWWVIGILVPVIGIVATVWANSGRADKAVPPPAVTTSTTSESPSASPAEAEPSTSGTGEETPATTASRETSSTAAPQESETGPERIFLNTLDPVDGGHFFASSVTLRGKTYADSLSSDSHCPPRGSIGYNLGTQWSKFTFTAGLDDNSAASSGSLTISADDETLWTGTVALGRHRELSLNVKDKLRLTIAYEHDEGCQGTDSWVVLGNATLIR
ncbi:NPCBM/NEW2 domain-containing protein [Streptomyces hydrogenans]|uniref:NPCBM/NEW2 domain-containing protein n=1 Tax=Streptomyces hydrogenans TaxID=1873719 RepID=UPI0033ADA87C